MTWIQLNFLADMRATGSRLGLLGPSCTLTQEPWSGGTSNAGSLLLTVSLESSTRSRLFNGNFGVPYPISGQIQISHCWYCPLFVYYTYLSIYLPIYLPIYLYLYLCLYLYLYLSISIHPYPSLSIPIHPYIHTYVFTHILFCPHKLVGFLDKPMCCKPSIERL